MTPKPFDPKQHSLSTGGDLVFHSTAEDRRDQRDPEVMGQLLLGLRDQGWTIREAADILDKTIGYVPNYGDNRDMTVDEFMRTARLPEGHGTPFPDRDITVVMHRDSVGWPARPAMYEEPS